MYNDGMEKPDAGPNDGQDWELVQRSLQGDSQAFTTLVHRYERLVFRIAGGFLRDRAEVEDTAQESFLKAFEALPRFRAGAPFGPWVAQIATRLCYDRLRARRRRTETSWDNLTPAEQAAARSVSTGATMEHSAAVRDLAERALATLAPKDRQALILVDAMGYSAAEAGKVMATSALAVRLRVHRARRAMRQVADQLMDGMDGRERGT